MPRVQGKRYVFTLNNPVARNLEELQQLVDRHDIVRGVKGQFERGEGEQTLHIQGLIVFHRNASPRCVREVLKELRRADGSDASPHFEVQRGSNDQAIEYVSKVDTRVNRHDAPDWLPQDKIQFEFGDEEAFVCRQGQRNDLLDVQRRLDDGEPMESIAEHHFGSFVRYHKGFSAYRLLRCAKRSWQTHALVIVGPPGCGKTTLVGEMYPNAFWVSQPNGGTLWFDGYDGHEVVVFDEFYGWVQRSMMQRLIDRSPMSVPVKGAMVPFVAKTVVILSNQVPRRWWPNLGLGAMFRRLTLPIGQSYSMSLPARSLVPLEIQPDDPFGGEAA